MMRGEDVFALQTALVALGFDTKGVDGIFGDGTKGAVLAAQKALNITVDGLAGGGTQNAITRRLSNQVRTKHDLPLGLVYGQTMHESSSRLGNYSPEHSANVEGGPYFDAGVAQLNVRFTPIKDAFDVPKSIERLGKHLRDHYDLFAGVPSAQRRWELAAGAWNAPAWAKWIARQEGASGVPTNQTSKPTDAALQTLEAYMQSATAFMIL